MDDVRRNVMVGAFVLVGLVALGAMVIIFGMSPASLATTGTYPLKVRFANVVQIRSGNLVTARGIMIGRVSSVDFADPNNFDAGVDVTLAIDSKYRIPKGSTAMATEPVLGQGRPPVVILPGSPDAPPLEPGATLDGRITSALDSIFPPGVVDTFQTAAQQIGGAAEALTPVLREIEGVVATRTPEDVDVRGMQGNVASAVARLDSALRHVNSVLGDAEVQSQVRRTVANAEAISEQGIVFMNDLQSAAADARQTVADAKALVAKLDTSVTNVQGEVDRVSRALRETLGRADTVLTNLTQITNRVVAGEGTVGKFFSDDKLYESLAFSVDKMTAALEELRLLLIDWRSGKVRIGL